MNKYVSTIALSSFLAIASLPAYAIDSNTVYDAGFKNLTPAQQADVLKKIADTAAENTKVTLPSPTTTKQVNEWVDIGSKIGSGFAAAAQSLGVAVNDFAKTPVGTFTMVLIAWNFLGHSLMHFIGGIIIWTVGYSGVFYMLRRSVNTQIKYSDTKTNIFGNSRIETVRRDALDGGYVFGMVGAGLLVTITGSFAFFGG